MVVLRIQHSVPSVDAWKRAFDSDPVDRRASGVRRYHVYRATADPNLVMIDLELGSTADAEKLLEKLWRLWTGPGAAVMRNPAAWIVEPVESVTL